METPAPASASTPADRGLAHPGAGENCLASPDLRTRPLHEEVSACARELWRKYGCPVGRDEQIWLEAERQLLGVDAQIARVGGSTPADTLNQTAPSPTAGPGGGPRKGPTRRNERRLAVSPGPASSGLEDD